MSNNPTFAGLSAASISQLAPMVQRPTYDRTALRPRTIHLGVGGFHRAHQAVYLDDLLQKGVLTDWGECGLGILPQDATMRDILKQQDYLYGLVERSADLRNTRVIGSMIDFIIATDGVQSVIERLADEETRLVSLTITEGGYFLNEGTGEFRFDDPAIQNDVRYASKPVTSLGFLAAGLELRRKRGVAPFTAMSCDNLQGNGHVLRRVLVEFAYMQDPSLATWIAENVAFPNSMVDRITPVTTDDDRKEMIHLLGVADGWPVVTEPFRQWVIEDQFCNVRPPWEEVGAEIVPDVLPYELMKMRLLNASHMAMAYLGALAGLTFVHEAMQDSVFNSFLHCFMEEVTPVVPFIPNASIPDYKKTLLQRFANPTIKDRVTRLCSEGSAKLPKWVLPSVIELKNIGRPTKLLTLAIASWIKYLQSDLDERGEPIIVVDNSATELVRAARYEANSPAKFLANRRIFGDDFFTSPDFLFGVDSALKQLNTSGVRGTLQRYLSSV